MAPALSTASEPEWTSAKTLSALKKSKSLHGSRRADFYSCLFDCFGRVYSIVNFISVIPLSVWAKNATLSAFWSTITGTRRLTIIFSNHPILSSFQHKDNVHTVILPDASIAHFRAFKTPHCRSCTSHRVYIISANYINTISSVDVSVLHIALVTLNLNYVT